MVERRLLDINEIEREFFIKGPTAAICKPKGFNHWCTLPYPKHPNGCPNFGKKESCPPFAPYFLDTYKPEVFVAFMRFDFGEFLERKREIHPDWTDRALANPRHFQRHLDSRLTDFLNIRLTEPDFENFEAVFSCEAMGVNMHLTAQRAGIKLEWPPRNTMYRIALIAQVKH